jgi:hypothetical protein
MGRPTNARGGGAAAGAAVHVANKKECGNEHPLFRAPFLLPLARYGVPEHGALDACFLMGEARPTLAVLYACPSRSWAGRAAVARQSCALATVCLVPENLLASPRVAGVAGLPSDAHSVVPVPGRGVLVASTNAVQFVGPTPTRRWSMCVNGFAVTSLASSSAEPLHDLGGRTLRQSGGGENDAEEDEFASADLVLTLDGMRWAWAQDDVLLLALARGELLELRLDRPEGRETQLRGRLLGCHGPFSCMAALARGWAHEAGHVFMGSRSADSVVVRWERPAEVRGKRGARD